MGLDRSTAYRHLSPPRLEVTAQKPRPPSVRRLSDDERAQVLEALDSPEFIDQTPREVYAALLSRGEYLCSARTMYRILDERGPVRERRNQRQARSFPVPRLAASAPNEVWTWDITKLPTTERNVFLSLYVVLDLFSRYVVAWMVARRENSALAKQLFAEAIDRHAIDPQQLVVHMDRGAPMTSHTFANLLSELGVDRSHSRPRVSNDNPFSESQFRTLKYQPDYPGRFEHLAHARRWCADFFDWHNDDHHHEGLALFTPSDVFFGRVESLQRVRQAALDRAFQRNPERFLRGRPKVKLPSTCVFINAPSDADTLSATTVLDASDAEVTNLFQPLPTQSTPPMIAIPGVRPRQELSAT